MQLVRSGFSATHLLLTLSVLLTVTFKALQYSGAADADLWKGIAGGALWSLMLVWLFYNKKRVSIGVLFAMSAILTVLALHVMMIKHWQIQNFVEHALQYATPALAGLYLLYGKTSALVNCTARVLIALTFIGHGVYAIGVDISSTNFVPMVTSILNTDVQTAQQLLTIAAVLDFVFAASMLTGIGLRVMIWYGVGWGLLTALARWYYFGVLGLENGTIFKAMVETGFRMCHGLVPLWYWQVYLRTYSIRNNAAVLA
jgi:hypothetical protein